MAKRIAAIAWVILLTVMAPASAQRRPEPPPYQPPEPLRNVADEEFRSAFRRLGYTRMAIYVHVHAADVAVEAHVRGRGATTAPGDGGRSGTLLLVIPKEDETNAWRIARTLGARLQDFFRHREIRLSLVGLTDLGDDLAMQVKALVLRDEQEAARRIGRHVGADLVVMLTLTRAVEEDASGARYGADFFVADVRRSDRLAGWAWDLRPDTSGAYPAPVLGSYAGHVAQRVRDRLVEYAEQASSPDGGTLHYHTLRFAGLTGPRLTLCTKAIESVPGLKMLRIELTTENDTPVAAVEVESPQEPAALAEEVRRRVAEALKSEVTQRTVREGTIEFTVRSKE